MSVHNIYSFYESQSSESEAEEMVEIDIETLTMEHYQKLIIFYKGLDIPTRQMLDCRGPIPRMTIVAALMVKGTKLLNPHLKLVLSLIKSRGEISKEQERTFLEDLEKVPVNTALIDTIRQTLDYTKSLQELVSKRTRIEEVSMVKLNALCLGNPKPIRMLIEMVDKSLQSPKGINGNVMVKIDKFIFPLDFVILYIIEDDKVPVILGRPMLATAHAIINVFSKKILLEVGGEKAMFNANEGKLPLAITSVGAINNFQVTTATGKENNIASANG
nr:hypothetical protein [Tanacetum cinerariifolium]